MVEFEGARPIGNGNHVVSAGEGLSEIAERHGLFWQTIWNHPDNAALRDAGRQPEVLMPGDRVAIPARRVRSETCETGQIHRFRRKGIPAKVVVNALDHAGRPLVGKRYELVVGPQTHTGMTGDGGRIEAWIAASARTAVLRIWFAQPDLPATYTYALELGYLDPVETLRGLRDRLHNVGYLCPRGDHPLDDATRGAIRMFQRANAQAETGTPDAAMMARLVAMHGS